MKSRVFFARNAPPKTASLWSKSVIDCSKCVTPRSIFYEYNEADFVGQYTVAYIERMSSGPARKKQRLSEAGASAATATASSGGVASGVARPKLVEARAHQAKLNRARLKDSQAAARNLQIKW